MPVQSLIVNLNIDVSKIESVSGGDINQCYKLITPEKTYFLKVNRGNSFPQMFNREAGSLLILATESSFKIPGVIKVGQHGELQFLLLEWVNAATEKSWSEAGRTLAEMHARPRECFGFNEDNYIGSLVQLNPKHDNWKDFFRDCRIMPLVEKLNVHLNTEDRRNAESLCDKADAFFPEEKAALLHGDLWSGNMMFCDEGPCIFDPAVYFGHREMDLAMTRLFGGFPEEFYSSYHETYPLDKGWASRLELAQLYPLLVHAVLFGGNYIASVKGVLKKYS